MNHETDLLTIRRTSDGIVTLNRLPVHARGELSAWDTAIHRAARIAARNRSGVVEAVVIDDTADNPTSRTVVITKAGEICESEPSPPPPPKQPSRPSVTPPRPLNGSTPAGSSTRVERKRAARRASTKRINVRWPLVIGALSIVAVGTAVLWGLGGKGDRSGPAPQAQQVAATPLNYSPLPLWQSPRLDRGVRSVAVPGGIAYVSADRNLSVLDESSGSVRWSQPFPQGTQPLAMAALRIDGRDAIAAQVGQDFRWWDLESGQEQQAQLPSGARLFEGGNGAVFSLSDGEAAYIARGELVTVDLPTGSTPVLVDAAGNLVAVSAAGSLHLNPTGKAGEPTPFPKPVGVSGSPTIAGFLNLGEGQVLTVWPAAEADGHPLLVVYSFTNRGGWQQAFRAELAATPAASSGSVPWQTSPSGEWGILGPYLVDAYRGQVKHLGDVAVVQMINDRAKATLQVGGDEQDPQLQTILVAPGVSPGVMAPGEPFPEVVTAKGAYVRDSQTSVLSLLPPR